MRTIEKIILILSNLKKHIVPLRDKDLIEGWYDREILLGTKF